MKNVFWSILVMLLAVTTVSAQTHNVTRGSKPSTIRPSTSTSKPRTTTPTKKGNAASSTRKSGGNRQQGTTGSSTSSRTQSSTYSTLSVEKRRIIDNLVSNMVYVKGGSFTMGATKKGSGSVLSKPTHQVTLSSFNIGRFEVTQEEWQAVMGSNPSKFKGTKRPVENVSWNDCQTFIRKLNTLTGKKFRLPTEAEWEFAARGGNKSRDYRYAGGSNLDDVGWYDGDSSDPNSGTHPVGQKKPNELGLYDLSGNVTEWCSNVFYSYSSSSQTNPKGPLKSGDRVYRGGDWLGPSLYCEVWDRNYDRPNYRSALIGFRLAISSSEKQETTQKNKKTSEISPAQEPASLITSAEKRSIIDSLVSNMVYVAGGTFMMGNQSSNANYDEKPTHEVTLSSFSIGRYEVTQEEWEAVMGSNPSHFKGAKHPVENVSWDDCQAFIQKLNAYTGKQFRLPTEAEWEFAARGGNNSRGYEYAGSNYVGSVAWHGSNSNGQTHPVGQKSPNELGLYDMSGNVWEFCSDYYYAAYSSSSQTNPQGPSSGPERVNRGGGVEYNYGFCRVSERNFTKPDTSDYYIGFRLAL